MGKLFIVTIEPLYSNIVSVELRRSATNPRELARAVDFVSFVLLNISKSELNFIKQILFFENKIFIDVERKETKEKLMKLIKQYHYPINCSIGPLEKQKPPTKALVLYAPYTKRPKEGKRKFLISWEVIKPDSKRVLLNKRLFGYTHTGKFYPGLLQKYKAEKLGKGCISVPVSASQLFLELFNEMKIPIKTKEVLDYSHA